MKKSAYLLPATLLLLLAALVRIVRIDAQPLSGDEAYSVVIWTQTSLEFLLETIAVSVTEPHPPLALLALHGWAKIAGDSVLSLRMFSVLAGMVVAAAGYQIARRLGGERVALIALALIAISPFQVWYSQFARNYSLWMAGSALAALFLLRGWRNPKRVTNWLPYVIISILTGYVFYLEAFAWMAHNLYALTQVWKRRDLILYWAGTQIAIAAALAPWYLRPELWSNSQDYTPNGWPANPVWGLQSLLVGNTLPPFLMHPEAHLPENSIGFASILVLMIVLVSLFVIWHTASRRMFWFSLFTSLVPTTGLALLSIITDRHYFHPRYLAASSIPLIITVALGIEGLGRMKFNVPGRRGLAGGIAGALVALSGIGLWSYQFDPAFARGPNWPAVLRFLESEATPDDLVIFNYPDPAFDYYYDYPARLEFLPNAANPTYDEVASVMDQVADEYDAVWFIPVATSAWDGEQQVARWLSEHRQQVYDRWIGTTQVFRYADWQADESGIDQPVDAQFRNVARLAGYRISPPPYEWQPNYTIYLELFWQPIGQSPADLKVFVHLLGPVMSDGSTVWAQDDDFPQGGRISTRTWEPDVLLRDVYTLQLPAELTSGEYQLIVGLYDPALGERILLENPQALSDAAELFTITLP